jgi:hypothetical protein
LKSHHKMLLLKLTPADPEIETGWLSPTWQTFA